MKFLNDWWGINENISPVESAERAAVMFLTILVMLRIYGMRPFGKESSFDRIITFFIGAILVRGIIGATPFFSTISAALVILTIHKILAKMTFYHKKVGRWVKGEARLLYQAGSFKTDQLVRTDITDQDILEEMRLKVQTDNVESISEIYLERSGELSFVKKQKDGKD